jgi:hypothetical protein
VPGVELGEPCLHLQQLTRPASIKELIHRARLNADILPDGRISVGDAVVVHGQHVRATIGTRGSQLATQR